MLQFEDGAVVFDPWTWETHALSAELVPLIDDIRRRVVDQGETEDQLVRELCAEALVDTGTHPQVSPHAEQVSNVKRLVRAAMCVISEGENRS